MDSETLDSAVHSIAISGMVEEPNDILQQLQKKQLSFRDLFPEEFIRSHTSRKDLADFLTGSGFVLRTQEDLTRISTEDWDKYIRTVSSYESFEAFKKAAVEYYIERMAR